VPNKYSELKALYDAVEARCYQCEMRTPGTKVVFSSGDINSKLVLIGEGPGEQEALRLETFVGPAGQRLNSGLAVVGVARERLYLMNIILCRTDSHNRTPIAKEWNRCRPRMDRQLKIVNPKVVIALGTPAGTALTQSNDFRIGKMRGAWTNYNGYPVMHTFHPAYFIHQEKELQKRTKGTPEYRELFKIIKRDMEYFLDDIRQAALRADELDPSLPPLLGVKT
jgi:uracil-DNA glycosylase family 4